MPTPNFHDAPDGSSSINHTGEAFWNEDDYMSETFFTAGAPPSPPPVNFEITENPFLPSPPAVNPLPNLNTAIGASHVAVNPNRRIEARMFSQGTAPAISPEWRPIPARSPDAIGAVPPNPIGYSRDFPPPCSPPLPAPSPPRRTRSRRGLSDPDAAIRKDPNAWSMREAVELCKLLEVVLPEAGFHIALTGGLLYKEGRRKDCDLMFYQIRQMEPNYEVLWKYLTVAGVLRSPSYPENGWLVKATYRGKLVDCLFPNAKKAKKVAGAPNTNYCNAAPPTPPESPTIRVIPEVPWSQEELQTGCVPTVEAAMAEAARRVAADREIERRTGIVDRTAEARRRMAGQTPYTAAELLATPAPAPISAAAEAQDDIPF